MRQKLGRILIDFVGRLLAPSFLIIILAGTSLEVLAKETAMVAMSDSIKLSTDFYLPDRTGPWPVLLIRTPYVKSSADYQKVSEPWTKDGWVMVVQDTRGRGESEGENLAYEADGWAVGHDGADTLKWIASQTWCDGHIVTAGHSASGIVQLLLAGAGGGPLSAQHISSATPSLFEGIYRQGVFRKTLVEDWLNQSRYSERMLKLWTSHSHYDEYWAQRDLSGHYSLVDVPAVHVGGWFDIFSQGTLDAFVGYNEYGGPHARHRQRLIMGPWTHALNRDHAGTLIYKDGRRPPTGASQPMAWFDYVVRGVSNGIATESPVIYYVMGDTTDPTAPGNFWRTADEWPPHGYVPSRLYLHADRTAGFALAPSPQEKMDFLEFVSDPSQPVPTVGGPQLPGTSLAPGPMDQQAVEERGDVLVFTTEPLPFPIEVTGRLAAQIWISSDCPDTDLVVRLCLVGASGKSYNMAEGAMRARFKDSLEEEHFLRPGEIYLMNIDLWSTSLVVNKGNRIRVQIASSSSPGYEVNPNNGFPLKVSGKPRIAHNRIYLDNIHASQLILPLAPLNQEILK